MDFKQALLPGLPAERIRAAYARAADNEIGTGKFGSAESSAALAANAFAAFLDEPRRLPPLPGTDDDDWPAVKVQLEAEVRFPWSRGRHPCLDVLVETATALIGIESKRCEPHRGKSAPAFSDAYDRPVWGDAMVRYEDVRDAVLAGGERYLRLDVAQLIKHAFGLCTAVYREGSSRGKRPILFYLLSEPKRWDGGEGAPLRREHLLNIIEARRIAVRRLANEQALRWAQVLEELNLAGIEAATDVAQEFAARGIPRPYGGKWSAEAIRQLESRLKSINE